MSAEHTSIPQGVTFPGHQEMSYLRTKDKTDVAATC